MSPTGRFDGEFNEKTIPQIECLLNRDRLIPVLKPCLEEWKSRPSSGIIGLDQTDENGQRVWPRSQALEVEVSWRAVDALVCARSVVRGSHTKRLQHRSILATLLVRPLAFEELAREGWRLVLCAQNVNRRNCADSDAVGPPGRLLAKQATSSFPHGFWFGALGGLALRWFMVLKLSLSDAPK